MKKTAVKEGENKVQEFMDKMCWSKAETARKSEIADKTVNKMLKRETTSRNSKIKIARAFKVPAATIFPNCPDL